MQIEPDQLGKIRCPLYYWGVSGNWVQPYLENNIKIRAVERHGIFNSLLYSRVSPNWGFFSPVTLLCTSLPTLSFLLDSLTPFLSPFFTASLPFLSCLSPHFLFFSSSRCLSLTGHDRKLRKYLLLLVEFIHKM